MTELTLDFLYVSEGDELASKKEELISLIKSTTEDLKSEEELRRIRLSNVAEYKKELILIMAEEDVMRLLRGRGDD